MASSEQKVDEQIPEDSRFCLFTDALDQASHKIVNKILSHKAFAECLPSMKKSHSEVFSTFHTVFSDKIQSQMKEEINQLISDLDLKTKLDLLDKLDYEQAELSQGDFVWRPTKNPATDLLAYDIPALQMHKEELKSVLKELHEENEGEKKKILEVVDRIREEEKLIEGLLTKNEKAIEILSSIPSL